MNLQSSCLEILNDAFQVFEFNNFEAFQPSRGSDGVGEVAFVHS